MFYPVGCFQTITCFRNGTFRNVLFLFYHIIYIFSSSFSFSLPWPSIWLDFWLVQKLLWITWECSRINPWIDTLFFLTFCCVIGWILLAFFISGRFSDRAFWLAAALVPCSGLFSGSLKAHYGTDSSAAERSRAFRATTQQVIDRVSVSSGENYYDCYYALRLKII